MSMEYWTRRRTFLVSLALGFVLALGLTAGGVCGGMRRFADTCADVREDTLRLHIVAASDTVLDQTLKLRVRDAVIVLAARLCGGGTDRADAEAALLQNLPLVVHTAQTVLATAGRSDTVTARQETAFFHTSHYGGDTLPAGRYRAVRITLGAGKGHNWWCCLYPALCLSASGAHYEKPAEDALVAGNYEIRFAVVEWWEKRKAESENISA